MRIGGNIRIRALLGSNVLLALFALGLAFWLTLTFSRLRLPAARRPAPPALTLPASVFALTPDDDLVEVVIFGGTARAHRARSASPSATRDSARRGPISCSSLHSYLDVNGDGVLTTAERPTRAPWTQLLKTRFNRRPSRSGSGPVSRSIPARGMAHRHRRGTRGVPAVHARDRCVVDAHRRRVRPEARGGLRPPRSRRRQGALFGGAGRHRFVRRPPRYRRG